MTGERPRVALILAAGRGLRMRPLSDALPKPALPLPGGALVEWAMRLAADSGVERIVVNAWHLAHHLERVVASAKPAGVELVVSREQQLMGTAGALALARDRQLLGSTGPILVVNGDGVLSLDLKPLLERHRASRDLVTLGLLAHPDPTRWSRVALDQSGRVAELRPPGTVAVGEQPLVYPGVMVVSRTALESLPCQPGEVPELLWTPARAARRLGGELLTGDWREVGTPADYLAAALAMLGGRPVVDPGATVAASAELTAALVGRAARIEGGSVVAESVVAEGAVVRAGARVMRSVLLGAVATGCDETVVDQLRAAPMPS